MKDLYIKNLNSMLKQVEDLQKKYGHLTVFEYFELEKKIMIEQTKELIQALDNRKEINEKVIL